MNLIIEKIGEDDIRKGRVRIPLSFRKDAKGNPIENGTLILLSARNKKVLRYAFGIIDRKDESIIQMDEHTRELLGVKEGEKIDFQISKASFIAKFLKFPWSHPDEGIQFANRIAIISFFLGILSVVISICK